MKKRIGIMMILLAVFVMSVSAASRRQAMKKTPVDNLYQTTLDNGLTVFVAENHAVPLVYIEIAVRAGAITQTTENAGLFHLYEHMMFKGNKLYPNAAAVQRAITEMGVSDWNGTTGTNCVNYFFTVPKDQLEHGLAFWNAAIRSPLMDEKELENEKKVVLAEIEGSFANPGEIYYEYVKKSLFPAQPYRLDPGGSSLVVQNATVAQLRDIQSRYYIPSNAALFVGGDINPSEVYELVDAIFGTWSNNGNFAPSKGQQQTMTPFTQTQYAVMPYDQLPEQVGMIEVYFRGTDTDFDSDDTYAADYLVQLLADPDGQFKQDLVSNPMLQIPDTGYVSGGYYTTRADGKLTFSATVLSPEDDLAGRAQEFLSQIQDSIMPAIADDSSLYTKQKVADIARKLKDGDVYTAETATGLLTNLRFWWICSSPEYYYTYNDKIASVTQKDVKDYVSKYISGKKALVTILVNPAVYERIRSDLTHAGYDVITADKAFWWKDAAFAPDLAMTSLKTVRLDDQDIYAPQTKKKSTYAVSQRTDIETYTLKNGIPIYVQQNKASKVDSVNIVVKGGIEHLTPNNSGLEGALFSMMSASSERYDYATRKTIGFDTQASIGSYTKVAGSALCLNTIDSYLYTLLPVLLDGFLHPRYEQQVYDNLMTGYRQSIQSTMNDPQSLLMYEFAKQVFKGHPFETRVSVTPDSLDNITVQNMQALHEKLLDPAHIFVVAVGSMNAKKLIAELDKTLGTLPSTGQDVRSNLREIPPLTIQGDPVVMTHPSAQGTGYVYRMFSTPSVMDKDFMAASLAADIYSSIMFNVIREKHGTCYSTGSSVAVSRASYGSEVLYKLSNPDSFIRHVKEARDYMATGHLIDSVHEDGTYSFSALADRLQDYKNAYIVSTYSSGATSAGIAQNLLYNIMSYNDMYFDRGLLAQVDSITAEQILQIFKKYWIDSPSQWWLMVGPDFKNRISF